MSRHEFAGRTPGITVSIGWDPPLGTFFLQVSDGKRDEPLLWRGGRYGECPEPGPLLRLAGQWTDALPGRLLASLLADELTAPARPPSPWLLE